MFMWRWPGQGAAADDLRQKRLGRRIAMQNVVLAALFVIDHELQRHPRPARPIRERRRAPNSGFLTLTIDDSLPKYSNSFRGCLWRYTMMRGEVLDVEVRSGIGVSILRMAVDVMIIKIVPSATADAAPVPAS